MSRAQVIPFPDAAALAESVARRWLDALAGRTSIQGYRVALSGGRIARQLFQALAAQAADRHTDLKGIQFFWADERCVPPTDPESNFNLANQHLLQPLAVPPENIHRIRGEIDPADAARIAQDELCRVAAPGPQGQPELDLVFLGMGEDGHTASLFPGSHEERGRGQAVYRAVIGSKPPPRRVTLNYPVLAAAREAWVLASGPGKEEALRASLEEGPPTTPLGRLLGLRTSTLVFTDIPLPDRP